jgi:hypothetical protein
MQYPSTDSFLTSCLFEEPRVKTGKIHEKILYRTHINLAYSMTGNQKLNILSPKQGKESLARM